MTFNLHFILLQYCPTKIENGDYRGSEMEKKGVQSGCNQYLYINNGCLLICERTVVVPQV